MTLGASYYRWTDEPDKALEGMDVVLQGEPDTLDRIPKGVNCASYAPSFGRVMFFCNALLVLRRRHTAVLVSGAISSREWT